MAEYIFIYLGRVERDIRTVQVFIHSFVEWSQLSATWSMMG